jgi:ribonucleoside-triphosphate reductase (thioredoxin)
VLSRTKSPILLLRGTLLLPSQEFVYTRTYSRWLEEKGRREFWPETVNRYIDFIHTNLPAVTDKELDTARQSILDMETMPSMRALQTAGPAATQDNTCLYNCSFIPLDDVQSFVEVLYILMCGTGVGFSVERAYVDKLPEIPDKSGNTEVVVVEDSRRGWADAFGKVLQALWRGDEYVVDVSGVRPKGARLRTMGGRASGPEPLVRLFSYASQIFDERRGRKLKTINCHDLACKVAEIVIVGGVRRSALISLSDLDDIEVAQAKSGEFWRTNPHRQGSNNSAVYNEKPDVIRFMDEWRNLIESKSGERGIFNREAAWKQMEFSRNRTIIKDLGTNPCGEILLRALQFCNLTSVVCRHNDTIKTLKEKVKIATMIGTWQSSFTYFPYLRPEWQKNCEEERLLGVSLSGLMDHPVLSETTDEAKKWLATLRGIAISTNKKFAKQLGISVSRGITCVKPEGNSSQVVNSSSGKHARWSEYYIRRYRISATDPLFELCRDSGVPHSPDIGEDISAPSSYVLEFPIASPVGAKTRHMAGAILQLEHWMMLKEFWCEHNPSFTCYVKNDEWLEVGSWVYRHWDKIGGISFLPSEDSVYTLAPYEEITKEKYEELEAAFPVLDFSLLSTYEMEDNTEIHHAMACTGDKCEL